MMKKIVVDIHRLGPIRNSEIELKPFIVFSGESGTGKSYAALLIHYIYRVLCGEISDFFSSINASFDEDKDRLPENEGGRLIEFSLIQFEEWISSTAIKYVSEMTGVPSLDGEVSVKFTGLEENYRFYYNKEVVEIDGEMKYYDNIKFQNLITRLPYNSGKWRNIPYELLFRHYLRSEFDITQDKTFLLPPSRGGLVCLNDAGRGDYRISAGGMYNEFILDLSDLKSAPIYEEKLAEEYSVLSHKLINGKINFHDNELFYEQSYGEIPITASAASIKELAPFAMMLQKGIVGRYSIMFEEPETNLHPELQIKTADIIAYLLQKGCRVQITTHSDYFLRRINDLIRLDIIKDKISKDEYNKLCNEHNYDSSLTIPQNKIGAYFFRRESEFETKIIPQGIGSGIPFDTFQSVLENQLTDSSYIYDKISEINETADN